MNREKNKDEKTEKQRHMSRAKLNLVLKIATPRKDGYHPLLSIFQEISFSDELEITLKEALREDDDASLSLTCSDPNCPVNESNTIVKADALLRESYPSQFTQSVDARLRKNIPMGSGLGGGSSNAATYLMAMNEMADLGASTEDLMRLGAQIGADVPFFLLGHNLVKSLFDY